MVVVSALLQYHWCHVHHSFSSLAYFIFALLYLCLLSGVQKGKTETKASSVFDLALIALTIYVYTYVVINYDAIAQRGGNLNGADLLVAILGILLIFEAARRASPSLAVLGLIFMAYNFLGPYIPGVFGHTGFSLKRILNRTKRDESPAAATAGDSFWRSNDTPISFLGYQHYNIC